VLKVLPLCRPRGRESVKFCRRHANRLRISGLQAFAGFAGKKRQGFAENLPLGLKKGSRPPPLLVAANLFPAGWLATSSYDRE
jgi:hypothetical protein